MDTTIEPDETATPVEHMSQEQRAAYRARLRARLERARAEITERNERPPGYLMVAAQRAMIRTAWRAAAVVPVSLERAWTVTERAPVDAERLADPTPGPDVRLAEAQAARDLAACLMRTARHAPRQAEAVRLMYGLDGAEELGAAGAAQVMGVSPQAVCDLSFRFRSWARKRLVQREREAA